jgi:hypothetical protein
MSAQGDPEDSKDPTWRSQASDEPRRFFIVLLIQRLSRFGFKFCHGGDPGSCGKWMEMVGMELEYNQYHLVMTNRQFAMERSSHFIAR